MEKFLEDFFKSKNRFDSLFNTKFDLRELESKLNNYIHMNNVVEEKNGDTILKHVPLPGFDKSDVNVNVLRDTVSIKAENDIKYCKNTSYTFNFDDKNYELVNVTLDRGILTLEFNKKNTKNEQGVKFDVK